MAQSGRCADSYAAVWRDREGVLATGKVVLGLAGLRLEGRRRDGGLCQHDVAYAELAGVHIGREPGEKLNGRPTLVLDPVSGESFQIALLGIGLLSELTGLLAGLGAERSASVEHVAVVVPLRKNCCERARLLLEAGPPFDLEQSGLTRHEVLIGEREVVFLFEGRHVLEVVQQLVRDPDAWRAARDWRSVVSGPPRVARSVFVWSSAVER